MAKKLQQFDLPPIAFEVAGATSEIQKQNLESSTESPGFPSLCFMLIDLIRRRADVAVFDFTAQSVEIKYQIDGLWHPMASMEREGGDLMLATLKHMAGTNFEERRARQDGSFKAIFDSVKYKFRVVSQGVKTGERVGVYLDFKRPPLETLEQLGMRSGMLADLVPLLGADQGLVVCAAIAAEGYTSLWRAFLSACDRFTRDYYVIEEKSKGESDVINVGRVSFDKSIGENAFSGIRQLLLREPEVIAFADLPDGETLNNVLDLVDVNNLMTMSRVQGKNAVDALSRLLALKPDVKRLAKYLNCVLSMRVVRKLCETCRAPFEPDAQLLASLGIPAGRVRHLYQGRIHRPGQLDERGQEIQPCPNCMGTGYRGRTGLFELLKLTDPIRKAIANQMPANALMEAINASGRISMRDEAVLLVAKGTTSLDEVQRVLNK